MNQRNAAQIRLQGWGVSSLLQERLNCTVRISSAKKGLRLSVNFSKPGYDLHPITIPGGLE
jgi:hypothetical protein